MKFNHNVRSALLAGVIALVIYVVIATITGQALGAALGFGLAFAACSGSPNGSGDRIAHQAVATENVITACGSACGARSVASTSALSRPDRVCHCDDSG